MSALVRVLPIHKPRPQECKDSIVITTVAKAAQEWCKLSPFLLGPCKLYDNYVSKNMENAWQYSKVYREHLAPGRERVPSERYFKWAKAGWMNPKAVRYPFCKPKKPEYSWWDGEKFGYIEARKKIYGPLYAEKVIETQAFRNLQRLYDTSKELILLDYDAYDHHELGMDLSDVLNNPDRKMGHAFVLAMLLTQDVALDEMELRL